MNTVGHLRIEEIRLRPGQEWQEPAPVWRFMRISAGAAYWLETLRPRALSEGEMVILGSAANGIIRASQINDVVLHGFSFSPGLLYGFFTVAERHFLHRTDSDAALAVRFLPSTHPLVRKFALLVSNTCQSTLAQRVELLGLVAGVIEEEIDRQQKPRLRGVSALPRFEQLIAHMPTSR